MVIAFRGYLAKMVQHADAVELVAKEIYTLQYFTQSSIAFVGLRHWLLPATHVHSAFSQCSPSSYASLRRVSITLIHGRRNNWSGS